MSTPRPLKFAPPLATASVEQDPVNVWIDADLGLVVDLGYSHDTSWMQTLRPRLVLVTHHHPDHAGGLTAAALTWPDALLAAPAPPTSGVAGIAPEQTFADERIVALPTPGHSDPHMAFYDRERRALYAGDLILGRGTPWVGPPEGSFAAYMASLDRIAALDIDTIYPGHGPAVGRAQLDWTIAHRRRRLDDVLDVLGSDVLTTESVATRLYVEREGMQLEGMHRMVAVLTVQGYLDYLVAQGRAARHNGGYVRA